MLSRLYFGFIGRLLGQAVSRIALTAIGLLEQLFDLLLKKRQQLFNPFAAHALVLARVGFKFRPVDAHRAHLQHTYLPGHRQHLDEALLEYLPIARSKTRDRIVIGMRVSSQVAHRHIPISGRLDLAAREDPMRRAIYSLSLIHI